MLSSNVAFLRSSDRSEIKLISFVERQSKYSIFLSISCVGISAVFAQWALFKLKKFTWNWSICLAGTLSDATDLGKSTVGEEGVKNVTFRRILRTHRSKSLRFEVFSNEQRYIPSNPFRTDKYYDRLVISHSGSLKVETDLPHRSNTSVRGRGRGPREFSKFLHVFMPL